MVDMKMRVGYAPVGRTWVLSKKIVSEQLNLVTVTGEKYKIMHNTVSVGLFKQFLQSQNLRSRYEITGNKADLLLSALNNPMCARVTTPFSLNDARAFARWLNGKTGRKFRIATVDELAKAYQFTGSHGHREWTETSRSMYANDLLFSQDGVHFDHYLDLPDSRSNGIYGYAFRLVEDIK